ncbi:TY-Chap domain-containing protein [Nocardia sp. NPDC003693]
MISWEEFEGGLAAQLSALPRTACLILDTGAPESQPGFAQFAQFDMSGTQILHAELGAFADLAVDAGRHSPGPRLALAVGWHPPGDWPNWWCQVPYPLPAPSSRQVAAMVVAGLRDGFHLPSPELLKYTAWDPLNSNRPLTFPMLRMHGSNRHSAPVDPLSWPVPQRSAHDAGRGLGLAPIR